MEANHLDPDRAGVNVDYDLCRLPYIAGTGTDPVQLIRDRIDCDGGLDRPCRIRCYKAALEIFTVVC